MIPLHRIDRHGLKHHVWIAVVAARMAVGPAGAADYFVAPGGDDRKSGSEAAPFASIGAAQHVARPGDTIHIRGGVYQMRESDITWNDGHAASLVALSKSGEKDRPILYCAARGERPVFNCSKVTPTGLRVSAFRVTGSWIHLKGIEITGVRVTQTNHTQSISVENLGDHNTFEHLSMHDSEAIGLYISRGRHNTILNCDAYRNHDGTSEDGRGGNTDGFGCHPRNQDSEGNRFIGCRAWFNSDDGFDCINAPKSVTFQNCWSFYNGYSANFEPLADGNGFKAGGYGITPGTKFPDPVPRHRVIGCLAVRNRSNGFYANHHPGGIDWIHNSACANGINFNFLGRDAKGTADIPGRNHRIINNLSHASSRDVANLAPDSNECAGNRFGQKRSSRKSDFIDLDESGLVAPRGKSGDLPEVQFLHLSQESPLTGTVQPTPEFPDRRNPGAF